MNVARLRLAPVRETMFPSRAPFFRDRLSPRAAEIAAWAEEIRDHKTYYDPRDLLPLLSQAGFRPDEIDCYKHKFGLNTFAACRMP